MRDAVIFYLVTIGAASVFVTVTDKINAKRRKTRIPEKFLLFLSVLGGSAPMLLTMLIIRHKTRHMKFMLGIPLIILLQIILALYSAGYIQ